MPTVVRLLFRTRTRGYIPFEVIYPSSGRYQTDVDQGFPQALALARQLGFLGYNELVDSVNVEVWSHNVEYL